jgi:hypothetical protein
MHDSSTSSRPPTSNTIRECKCGACGTVLLTVSGTPCRCGGQMMAQGNGGGMTRKAFGLEDTDLIK